MSEVITFTCGPGPAESKLDLYRVRARKHEAVRLPLDEVNDIVRAIQFETPSGRPLSRASANAIAVYLSALVGDIVTLENEVRGRGRALRDVLAERERWRAARSDAHAAGELAHAAAALCAHERDTITAPDWTIPLYNAQADDATHDEATRKRLVLAAMLLLEEIEQIDRAAASPPSSPTMGG